MSQALPNLSLYQGIRCEVSLLESEMLIQRPGLEPVRIALPSSQQSELPLLQSWGQGICLLNPANAELAARCHWEPGLNYGLELSAEGCYLLSQNAGYDNYLVSSRQLIYPGYYNHKAAQGPFDLFVSEDQRLLGVVNRQEGHVLVIEPGSAQVVARHHFKQYAGPKVLCLAIDSIHRSVWLCGPGDRRVWRWNLDSDQVEAIEGNWRYPGALALQNQTLWVLDSAQQTLLHGLELADLKPCGRISVNGSSYAQQTDTPGDWLLADSQGQWLAVMTHVNFPAPFSPQISVIWPQARSKDHHFQPLLGQWPVMLALAEPNRALEQLAAQAPLNQEWQSQQQAGKLPGLVKALLANYPLKLPEFRTQPLILAAEPAATQELPGSLRELILTKINQALKTRPGLKTSSQPHLEKELTVHAARLAHALQSHQQLQLLLLGVLDGQPLQLEFRRDELLAELKHTGLEDLDKQESSSTNLPAKSPESCFVGLADPLNSRILQLNAELEVFWQLETTLFGVYRPLDVSWQTTGFVVLDGESRKISCWNEFGKQSWSFDNAQADWDRFVYFEQSQQLFVLDSEQGELRQVSLQQPEPQELAGIAAGQVQDICRFDSEALALLEKSGRLSFYKLGTGLEQSFELQARPTRMALSADRQNLVMFEGKNQRVWLWSQGQLSSQPLELTQRFRIEQALSLGWLSPEEIFIADAYRIISLNPFNGEIKKQHLLQELKLAPENLAPQSVFMAKASHWSELQISLWDMLKRVPLFHEAPDDFLRELSSSVSLQVYNRGDLIVRQGETGDRLYLIRSGQAQVLDASQKQVVAKMYPGEIFGEVSLMLGLPRNASVRAASYCELFSLAQADLDALLPDYPEVRERLLKLAQERQQQAELRSEVQQEQLQKRIQHLLAQKPRSLPSTRAGSGRVEIESELALDDLTLWVRHPQACQLAKINRQGQVMAILGVQQGLVQPHVALETYNGIWVLDSGLNSLCLMEQGRTRLNLSHWGQTQLLQPRALAETALGSLWIANTGQAELLHLSSSGELLERFSHGKAPVSIEVLPNGHLLVADSRQHTVTELTSQGEEVWRYGTPRSMGRDENRLFAPEHAQALENGHVVIADTGNNRILEVEASGRIVRTLASSAGLRVTRPTQTKSLAGEQSLIEHSNHFYWLQLNSAQQAVWRYTLPVKGFYLVNS